MTTGLRITASLDDVGAYWPHLLDATRAAGVRAIMALPLRLDDDTVGSLNLYSTKGRLTDLDETVLAAVVAVLEQAVRDYARARRPVDLAAGLRAALAARAAQEQATGALMAQHGLSPDQARSRLVEQARQAGTDLETFARNLILEYADHPKDDPGR